MASKFQVGLLGSGFLGKALMTMASWPEPSWRTVLPGSIAELSGSVKSAPVQFDWADDSTWADLPDGTAKLVITIPPALSEEQEEADRLRRWCRWMKRNRKETSRIIYISSTGVYPNLSRVWVETDQVVPDNPKGRIRYQTELILRENFKATIIRSGAIYGPGRHIGVRMMENKPIPTGNQPVHRIHVIDLARIVLRSLDDDFFPPVVNAVDLKPAPTREVAEWLAQTDSRLSPDNLNFPAAGSSRKHQNPAENRLISNDLLINGLGFRLLYPTYKEGFQHIKEFTTEKYFK